MSEVSIGRRLAAECLGTMLLLATVVGSGVMAENLAAGNIAVALLGNTVATAVMLVVLIMVLAPVSGAHFNPAVTFAFYLRKEIDRRSAVLYVLVQCLAAVGGVILAHMMFELPAVQQASTARSGSGQWLSEVVATLGLVLAILGTLRWGTRTVAASVGLYIAAAYWFTASTSFANPAVTLGRTMTDTFSGIQPLHAPAFVLAQFVGAALAVVLTGWLMAGVRAAE